MRLSRGAQRTRVAVCRPTHDIKQRSPSFFVPTARFAARVSVSLCSFLFFTFSVSFPFLLSLSSSPRLVRGPCCVVSIPAKGMEERREAPGCCVLHPGARAMTGTRAPNEAPGIPLDGMPASRRSTVAICASDNALPHAVSPFGLVPALLSLSLLTSELGRGTFRHK